MLKMENCNKIKILVDIRVKLVKEGKQDKVYPTLYKQMVETLRYLCNIRSKIAYKVSLVSRFM